MAAEKSLRKRVRFKTGFPALSRLPRPAAYHLAKLLGRRDARRHETAAAVRQGLLKVFPELGDQTGRLEAIVRQHFQMMARDTLDCFAMPRFTADNCRSLIRVEGADALISARDCGRGVILVISHFGRFFMLGPGLNFQGIEFGMLTTMPDERHPSYDPVDRWYISTKLRNTQEFTRGSWITTVHDPRRIYRALRSGEIILIALDGNETISHKRLDFPFLDGQLSLPEGIVRIAAKTGAKLVYAAAFDRDPGVEIRLKTLPDDPLEAMYGAVALLENDLTDHPAQWWQWPVLDAFWRPESASCREEA